MPGAGAAQIHVLSLVADGSHRMTQLPQDLFVDPSEDPDDVVDRVPATCPGQKISFNVAVTALHDARTEVEELQTLP